MKIYNGYHPIEKNKSQRYAGKSREVIEANQKCALSPSLDAGQGNKPLGSGSPVSVPTPSGGSMDGDFFCLFSLVLQW